MPTRYTILPEGHVYELSDGIEIPAPYPIKPDRVAQYMEDRRFLRANRERYEAYWEQRNTLRDQQRPLEQQQQVRYSQQRAKQIMRLEAQMEAMSERMGDMPYAYSQACTRCQSYRQDAYGCWYGPSKRWRFADNWVRSYGRVVPADQLAHERALAAAAEQQQKERVLT